MQTQYGVGRGVVVAGAVFVMLLGSTAPAMAQWRSEDRSRILALSNLASGSRIGLSIEDVADDDAADEGAVILDVRPESPAESAGFAEGDVMVEFDGERVRSARQLTRLVQETPAGRTVGAAVMRDGRRVELEVTPEPASSDVAAVVGRLGLAERLGDVYTRVLPDAGRNFTYGFRARPVRLGVNVQALSPQLADYFGVDDGVLVSSVDEESAAADAGLQAGDVITSVDGRSVEDSASLRRRLSAADPGEEVSIGVTRAGRELELTATLDQQRGRRPRPDIFKDDGRAI